MLITLITAPFGSFGISLAGPRLLSLKAKSDVKNLENKVEEKRKSKKKNKGYSLVDSFDSGDDFKVLESSNPEEPENSFKVNFSYEHDSETISLTKL